MSKARDRILILGKYYAPFNGGIEHVTRQFAERLAQNYDVDVLVSSHDRRSGTEEIGSVQVIRLATQLTVCSQPISLGAFPRLSLRDYAGVQLHAPNPFMASVLWPKMVADAFRTPLMIVHHMEIAGRRALRTLLMPAYRHLARRSAWVAVTSPKNHSLSRDLPRDARVVTLPLFVDRAEYPLLACHRESAACWRRRHFGNAPLVGFVGRHARYKGLDVLVHALATMPDVRAVLAGEGPCRGSLMALAARLGVADRIVFPGTLTHAEKCRLLAAIDVFALPSTDITEAFGVSQLEAMLLGAVVVASNLPTGVTDVAIDEATALLARPGDSGDLARQLRRALSDAGLRRRLRDAATRHVEARFSRERVLDELEHLTRVAMAPGGSR